jgi:thiopurine S-methyltransferase
MERHFWLERWEQEQIGFHQSQINAYLSTHWQELGLMPGASVFVPLCGKSLDMLWLREQGHPVFGVELSEKAVKAFFEENGLPATVQRELQHVDYSADGLKLRVGDFFALQREELQGIDAVYDRASLIALPPAMRRDYVRHMAELLSSGAHILLITMEYPDGSLDGPPFSVPEEEVQRLFAADFHIQRKALWEGAEGPRGVTVTEKVYSLKRR